MVTAVDIPFTEVSLHVSPCTSDIMVIDCHRVVNLLMFQLAIHILDC